MALDFYRLDNKEYLFGLNDKQFDELTEIFTDFQYQTGFVIDQYGDFKMTVENQGAIIRIIDRYIDKTDLNKNKSKTLTIIEFRTLLKYYSQRRLELQLKGD
ncbi:hypothetical protein ACFSC6_17550 [Rufibacter sediminis]|uniref:Uncharacterized protein n=1 Tax=Rufibacter sediminis TaxID=2762756 RepID=A0ABR6VQ60_9BACT|nr:hypothetical protein [Rufibacter sediminis]MBC3539324.1 hypothetical protein [Rufibacter sediminis]